MLNNQRGTFFWTFIILASCLVFSCSASAAVRINELMASNKESLLSSLNESSDWIELYNEGNGIVNIGGMYLTDDATAPTRWEIPAGTQISGKGYLIIWADGKYGDNELHANFSLSANGEQLALYDTDGQTLLDSVVFDRQVTDISYGRSPSTSTLWQYMSHSTPGTANKSGYVGLVADTQFSVDRGFYDQPFQLEITTTTPDVFLFYTTDGSDPIASSTISLYSDPITIDKTTCLRAYAMKPGWLPTNVDTQTYLFLDDVITFSQAQASAAGYPNTWFQSEPGDYEMDPDVTQNPEYKDQMKSALLSLPTLSLVTDKQHLFNKTNNPNTGGIYIYTGHSSTGGRNWERPVSAEFFDANGAQEFQVNCGLRIQGGESRRPSKMPKHSLSLRFREEYGPSKLDIPFFDNWPVDSFDSLQLRGFFNNSWAHWSSGQRRQATYVRDQWIRDALTAMGQEDAGQGFYVHLYINGMYWGLYNLEERPEEDHYAAYHGGSPDTVDAINGGSATHGTTQAWNNLKQVVRQKNWSQIQTLMDVDNFIDFMMAQLYSGNQDLKTNGNWRAAGGGEDQRPWRFYAWDSERILENPSTTSNRPSQDPTGLWNSLKQIEQFRHRFADRVHKHLFNNGPLTPGPASELFSIRANEIEGAVITESARWGDYRASNNPYTRNDHWYPERDRIINTYFPQRTDVAVEIFKNLDLYPDIEAPEFYIDGQYQHGGAMSPGQSLSMISSEPSILYTLDGTDPRNDTVTPPDSESETFVLVEENATKKIWVPLQDMGTAWQGNDEPYDDSSWTDGTPTLPGATGGVGYEFGAGYESFITYDLLDAMYAMNASCYIRIPFTLAEDDYAVITGMALHVRCDDGCVVYLNGEEIGAINKPNPLQWNSGCNNRSDDTGFAIIPVTKYISQLKTGLNILAVQAINQRNDSSDFLFSAELVGTTGDNANQGGSPSATAVYYSGPVSLPYSTRVKARSYDGQWSALNEAVYSVGPIAENLRITELMYHPKDPNAEYVELLNIGSETINLNLVHFSNGINFTFGTTDLMPGEHILIVKNITAFQAIYGDTLPVVGEYQGSLDNAGERLVLQDASNVELLNFKYKDGWYESTDGPGFSMEVTDPAIAIPATFSDKATWQASHSEGGTPGS